MTAETETLTDQGPDPFVTDIEQATMTNANFRTTLWTGSPSAVDADEHRPRW